MHILDIIVISQQTSPNGREVTGQVQFTLTAETEPNKERSKPYHLTLDCVCRTSARVRSDALLIGAAIRQLRRRPEVQSGQNRISFAKGLSPLQSARAA